MCAGSGALASAAGRPSGMARAEVSAYVPRMVTGYKKIGDPDKDRPPTKGNQGSAQAESIRPGALRQHSHEVTVGGERRQLRKPHS